MAIWKFGHLETRPTTRQANPARPQSAATPPPDATYPHPVIAVSNVAKSYGSFVAVRGVSLEARPGQVAGLLGPNGAGKTTLIRMIAAYLTPTTGSIQVCGHDTVDESGQARAAIGYLPEAAPLYPEMSVEGYLKYRAGLFGISGKARRAAVDRAISRCWLPEMRTRRISALSKGYRQRTGLAAALLHDPPVVILDEPTSGLDPTQIRGMRDLIRELGQTKTVLISSHILPEVEQTCDRVLIIARGKVRADGTPAELLSGLNASAGYTVVFAPGVVPERARTVLANVAGVLEIRQTHPEAASFVVIPQRDAADLRELIALAAQRNNLLVVELTRSRPTLEQVFVDVVSHDEPAGAVGVGGA